MGLVSGEAVNEKENSSLLVNPKISMVAITNNRDVNRRLNGMDWNVIVKYAHMMWLLSHTSLTVLFLLVNTVEDHSAHNKLYVVAPLAHTPRE